MKNIRHIFSTAGQWNRIAGYSDRKIIDSSYQYLTFVEYTINTSKFHDLKNKTLLFFSDLHYGSAKVDISKIKKILLNVNPDWIVFGGDLITYACYQEDAFSFLKEVFADFSNTPKIAVYGNWDRRRNKWYPDSIWIDEYKKAGFNLIINDNIQFDSINFYGLDEPKLGSPMLKTEKLCKDKLNCIISHSVEPVIDSIHDIQNSYNKIYLCGHSHGGQIRIPVFGAMVTSTKYWKLFEYGHYHSQIHDANLIMTSGIGTTRLPFRLFCDPEVVIIKFTDSP
jgi:predicted MPP superfamily phosphohydrolase